VRWSQSSSKSAFPPTSARQSSSGERLNKFLYLRAFLGPQAGSGRENKSDNLLLGHIDSSRLVLDADAVYTVALIGIGEPLTLKDMAKVATTLRTHDLDSSHSHGVVYLDSHAPFVALIESRPTTATVELGCSRVKRMGTATALEVAFVRVELVVLSRSTSLRSFVPQHLILIRC
jgi:hypothetical protein